MNIRSYLLLLSLGVFSAPFVQADRLSEAEKIAGDSTEKAIASQARIDEVHLLTQDMFQEYRAALSQTESLATYNKYLQELIDSQEAELTAISDQIESIGQTQQEVLPLIDRMVQTLEKFISADLPFLSEERAARALRLRANMKRADISLSEKYRQVLEAYQIENDYGRSLGAYQMELNIDTQPITVDVLRLGRVALYYRSLDGTRCGRFNREAGGWTSLDCDYEEEILAGIRLANNQSAPGFLELPLWVPTETKERGAK